MAKKSGWQIIRDIVLGIAIFAIILLVFLVLVPKVFNYFNVHTGGDPGANLPELI